MTTYAEAFEKMADGELIDVALFGTFEDYIEDRTYSPRPWSEVRPVLEVDIEYGSDLRVVAWTPTWILFTREYDSSISVARWPRNPRALVPCFNGLTP